MRRSLTNPRVLLLSVLAVAMVVLFIATVIAYWDLPRVRVAPGLTMSTLVVPEGRSLNQEHLLARLNAPEFAEQLMTSSRAHRRLFEPSDRDNLTFSVAPCLVEDLAVYGVLSRMYSVEGSRFGLVLWLQDRLPGMPDMAELDTEVNQLNREAHDLMNREVKQVVAALRHPFPQEWKAACQLVDELREPFEGIGFGVHSATKHEIVIDVFGANSRGKLDRIFEQATWIKRGMNVGPKVKLQFFDAAMSSTGTIYSSF